MLFRFRFASFGFTVNFQDDLAQTSIIDIHMELPLKEADAYYLQGTVKGVGRAGWDLVGRLTLRTEATTLPSAGRKTDDLNWVAGAVLERERDGLSLTD